MNINDIKFGNSTEELRCLSEKSNLLTNWFNSKALIDKFISSAPNNDSDITKRDFQIIQLQMSNTTVEDIVFAEAAEYDMHELFIELVKNHGYQISKKRIINIINQTDPLLFFLKEKINRPRPAQLSYYYGIDLYPLIHTDANSAAYPSGHTLDSLNVAKYLSILFPQLEKELIFLAHKISNSRIYTGLHYPSDEEVSFRISEIIWKNNLLKID